jgi:hypothetical protein
MVIVLPWAPNQEHETTSPGIRQMSGKLFENIDTNDSQIDDWQVSHTFTHVISTA